MIEVDVDKDSDGDDDLQIDVINRGTRDIDDVVLIEELREQVIFLSVRTGSPGCLESGGIVICELGTIPGGDTASVDMRVDSNGTDPTSGRTTVTVGGVPVGVIDEPYISKIGSPPVAGPGTDVTYTIRVINPTTDTARSLVVEDDMPVSLEVLSAESTSGSVRVNGQLVRFTQGALAPGRQITIIVQTRVREDGDFNNIINEACLTSSSNPSPSCAQMQFLRASALPATGEAPTLAQRITRIALPLAALLIVILGGWIVINRPRVEA